MTNYQLLYTTAIKVLQTEIQGKSLQVFLDQLQDLIRESLKCEDVAIFLTDHDDRKSDITATDWGVTINEHMYQEKGGGKSIESVQTKRDYVYVYIPIANPSGENLGVICCRNKRRNHYSKAVNEFNDDDILLLETISQSASPLIRLIQDRERRTKALGRITHELKVPLVAIRGATELMLRASDMDKPPSHDYLNDIWSWSELLRRLLGVTDLFGYTGVNLPIQPTLVSLKTDVVVPAVKQAKLLLDERGFSIRHITYSKFRNIPKLWVDKNQFQQIIFNLLSNAVKHCYSKPDSFKVEIASIKTNQNYLIQFRDWGPGISDNMMNILFQEGARDPKTIANNVTGQGLGLWVVSKIVEVHDGRIELTNQSRPTEFTIYLPRYLESVPPRQARPDME
jgi:signal transduction histidine kinase